MAKVDEDHLYYSLASFWDEAKDRGLMKGMDEYELQEIDDEIREEAREVGFSPKKHRLRLVSKDGEIRYKIVHTGTGKKKKKGKSKSKDRQVQPGTVKRKKSSKKVHTSKSKKEKHTSTASSSKKKVPTKVKKNKSVQVQSKSSKHKKLVSYKFSPEMVEMIDKKSKKTGIPRTRLVEQAITAFFKKKKASKR